MCNFCSLFCCSNCLVIRKRAHPLSKDGSGKRYNICQDCDTKYLKLQLGHVLDISRLELCLEPNFTIRGNFKDFFRLGTIIELIQLMYKYFK